MMVEKLDLEQFLKARRDASNERNLTKRSKSRCKSAQMTSVRSNLYSGSARKHTFSRRPMMNQLMTALVANNSEQDNILKPNTMVNIKFKYRQLGVNA